MKTRLRIPHVLAVEVPRPHVVRVTFDDGLVKEWEFMPGRHEGTVFEPFNDPDFFRQARVDPECRTVVWPNGVDLDPVVLHGDLAAANGGHFGEVSESAARAYTQTAVASCSSRTLTPEDPLHG